jgi:tRNA A37 threonylcarbamoyladenosine synthetase subunit TsaC/SUA5/YrdC
VSVTTAEALSIRDAGDRARAAATIADGGIVVCAFNGIYTLLVDADAPAAPARATAAKGRSETQGLALVCPPEYFAEHVALDAPVLRSAYRFSQILDLYRSVHAVGVIVPAALPGAPPHLVQSGTVLNVWTEERPSSPLRELVRELRSHGRRALAGTSANRTGEPTITTAAEATALFSERVDAILVDDFENVAEERRRSASLVDLTHPIPRLVREGSVPSDELRTTLRELGLGDLAVPAGVRRV